MDDGNQGWDGHERRRSAMSPDELNALAKAVAKEAVKEVFTQMAVATGKGILSRLWWILLAIVGFLGVKFGFIKIPMP